MAGKIKDKSFQIITSTRTITLKQILKEIKKEGDRTFRETPIRVHCGDDRKDYPAAFDKMNEICNKYLEMIE